MSFAKLPLIAACVSVASGLVLGHMGPDRLAVLVATARQAMPLSEWQAPPVQNAGAGGLQGTGFRPSTAPWETIIEPNALGHFIVDMEVGGNHLDALVDTGASYVALSYEDAARIGLHPSPAEFKYEIRTANGVAHAASAVLREIRVGNVEARQVQAIVSEPGALTGHSLLGMSFLRRLSGFQVDAGRLVLKQ